LLNSAERTQDRMQEADSTPALPASGDEETTSTSGDCLSQPQHHRNTLLMKVIGPVIAFVDRPWKASVVQLGPGEGSDLEI